MSSWTCQSFKKKRLQSFFNSRLDTCKSALRSGCFTSSENSTGMDWIGLGVERSLEPVWLVGENHILCPCRESKLYYPARSLSVH